MDKISLLVQDWYQTRNEALLEQIFAELQESNIHFFGAYFRTWKNKAAINDANECIQIFCVSLFEKLTKEDDPTPIKDFRHYCGAVRRRICANFKKVQQKRQQRIVAPVDPASGKDIFENLPYEDSSHKEDQVWGIYLDFMENAPKNHLSYEVFRLRIENKISHEEVARHLNKKFGLTNNNKLDATRVRKRYSKLLNKWREHCSKILKQSG